ncbi:MAG: flagellar biosynthetic protein FliO [Alphaproteobacteria bacterium]|nr:flagellar biosynthetic protein FliO [Alphaproteobacteria bacterium]
MGTLLILKFFSVFVFVICLMLLLAFIIKKSGFAGLAPARASRRRLKIVEYLPVDHKHRLVLVRRDNREHLLLLGHESETVVETGIVPQTGEDGDTVVPISRDPRNVKI